MQLVVPSAVSAADMMLAIICKMVFQVSFFIVRVCFLLLILIRPFNVERLPSICHVEHSPFFVMSSVVETSHGL
jgi:hypothetical protein